MCDFNIGPDDHWYRFNAENKTFDEAVQVCAAQAMGGRLMAIKSSRTWDFLKSIYRSSDVLWIGATDRGRPTNQFHWVDGVGGSEPVSLDFSWPWQKDEPTNFELNSETEDCIQVG